MLKIFLYFVLIVFIYAFNAGVLKEFQLFGALPNLFLLLVIYLSMETKGEFYLAASFFCGLLLDFSVGVFLGSFSVSFMIIALILRSISHDFVVLDRNWKYLPVILLLAQALVYIWIYFYNRIAVSLGVSINLLGFKPLMNRFVWESVYNLAFIYPIWKIVSLVTVLDEKFLGRRT